MIRARYICGLAAALLAASALASPALADKADNSVRFAVQNTLPSLDKYFNAGTVAGMVSDTVWDTLIYRNPASGEYVGNLATAWRWIDDTTLEFDLRQGVKFHNGAEFTADDVVYTLNFATDPDSKVTFARLGSWIERVEKLGTYRVRILTNPAAIGNLASPDIPIYPHAYYAAVGPKGMNDQPVGSGPYRVVEHAIGKHVRFERNRDYFKDSPKPQPRIDTVEMRFIPDAQTRVAEVVAAGLDLIIDVARDQAEQLRDIPSLRIVSGETANVASLRLNSMPTTRAPALRDVRVRQAIMHAIDRETMAKHLVGENARVLPATCHPIEFGCNENAVPRYSYDPARSRQLLADAGYKDGFDIELYATRSRNEAEAIIGYLRDVRIRTRLRFVQIGAFTAARRSGRVSMYQTAWLSQPLDVSHELSAFHTFTPDDQSRDPEVRDLVLRGGSTMDPAIRKDAYSRALALIAERAYVLPLYSLPVYYASNSDLVVSTHTDGRLRFYEMYYR